MTPTSISAGQWSVLTAAAVFAAVLVAPIALTGDALYWHIAAGRWMIENQAVLRINLYSYTAAGDAWVNQAWLAQLALAGAYVGAGFSGVVVLVALVTGLSAGLLGFFLARGRRLAVAALWLALVLICSASAIKAQPYVLALPCLVGWTGVLARAKAPPLKLLPVMLLWANVSTSFIFGLILAVVIAAEAVLFTKAERLTVARGWAVFLGAALLLCLATPTGVFGLAHAMRLLHPAAGMSVLPLLIGLPAAAMLAPERRMIFRLVFLAGLFVLSLSSGAAELTFAVCAALLAAGPAGEAAPGFALKPVFALVLVVVIGATSRVLLPINPSDDATTPLSAINAVPVNIKRLPVFNERVFGGFLIFRDVKPFIDGRPLYSPAFTRRTTEPDLLAETLSRYHVRWTILKPENPVVAAMDGLSGWHRLYADQWAVVHVRNDTH